MMNYGLKFVTLYRRQGSRPPPWKRNAKKQNGCLGGLRNSCEKKRGETQRRKGKRLKLADLYCLPGEKKQLENLWKAAIVRHFKVKNFEERLKEAGKTFKPFITENFYFDGRGIHFIYDPYEIDCFAAGTIDIFVPWKMPR